VILITIFEGLDGATDVDRRIGRALATRTEQGGTTPPRAEWLEIQMRKGGLADEGVDFHNRLVFFFFAFVELLGKIIFYAHLADGM
jgi:hypothetical protein